MDFIIEKKDITVRELINKLLDCRMDDLIIIKDIKDTYIPMLFRSDT